ncbi:MAG: VOC family protein [Blastocatellia bacterium]
MKKHIILSLCLCVLVAGASGLAQGKRPRITGVAHMALYVSDIEKSLGFYRDFLGFQEPYRLNNPDGSLSLTFIKVNEDQYIELFPGLKPQQDRLNHISFQTENAEALRTWLGTWGVAVPSKVNQVRIGNTSFNVKDPEGHTLEFTQYQPEGWTRREKGKFADDRRISKRIMHLGIIVGDVPAAVNFYGDALGLREFWRGNARNTNRVSWINMRLPDSQDYVEWMLYADKPAPDKRGSQHHICMEVPDIEKAKAELESRPWIKQYNEYKRPLEIRTGVNQRRQMNLYDPDGTRIELMEPRTVTGKPTPSSTSPLPDRK